MSASTEKHRHTAEAAGWATRPERGSLPAIRGLVWVALHAGRPLTRMLLLPICAYFVMFSPDASAASRDYLRRALARRPTMREQFRHFYTFAACLLDRVYMLNGRLALFEFTIAGSERVREYTDRGEGCLLFGAHFGSFEAVRAVGRQAESVPISLVMYKENARKSNEVLNAINPNLALEIIALGTAGAMLAVRDRLAAGYLVGVLADRGLHDERFIMLPFLGATAAFPTGPFRMALLLRRPIILMFGIYRGGRRYDVHFEPLAVSADFEGEPEAAVLGMMRRYVSRLEHCCRSEPYNWFNFYPFWSAA